MKSEVRDLLLCILQKISLVNCHVTLTEKILEGFNNMTHDDMIELTDGKYSCRIIQCLQGIIGPLKRYRRGWKQSQATNFMSSQACKIVSSLISQFQFYETQNEDASVDDYYSILIRNIVN